MVKCYSTRQDTSAGMNHFATVPLHSVDELTGLAISRFPMQCLLLEPRFGTNLRAGNAKKKFLSTSRNVALFLVETKKKLVPKFGSTQIPQRHPDRIFRPLKIRSKLSHKINSSDQIFYFLKRCDV